MRRDSKYKRAVSDAILEAVSQWVIAPGGVGHAVRTRKPPEAYCGKTAFTGGFFTPRTPQRICRACAGSLGAHHWLKATWEPPPAPRKEQGRLFEEDDDGRAD